MSISGDRKGSFCCLTFEILRSSADLGQFNSELSLEQSLVCILHCAHSMARAVWLLRNSLLEISFIRGPSVPKLQQVSVIFPSCVSAEVAYGNFAKYWLRTVSMIKENN